MPKILILVQPGADVAPLADAAAEGARAVRFSEVDVRRIGEDDAAGPASRYRALESVEALASYDAILLGAGVDAGTASPALDSLLERAATTLGRKALVNKVGSAISAGASAWPLLARLGDLGMIVVAPSPAGEGPDAALAGARELGHRVAHVVGWVTHARSHHHH